MNEKQIRASFDMGFKDAQKKIDEQAAGHSSLDHLIHYHALKKSGNPSINGHSFGSFSEAKKNGEFSDYDIMEDPFARKYTYMQ